jgi:hypothetical protein
LADVNGRDMRAAGAAWDAVLAPHLDAIRASVHAGFVFWHLPESGNMLALSGFRATHGAMDTYLARGPDDAFAARYRLDDLECPNPPVLWQQHGTVAEVVTALLALPAHGTPGAPALARRAPSELWTPGTNWS